jgi:hypothetical protein
VKTTVYRRKQGQAMVEAALAIPLVLLCTVAVIYFGRAYYLSQVLSFAAQEGARACSAVPGLQDTGIQSSVVGFDSDGTQTDPSTVISRMLGSAKLLSQGTTGNLPPGAKVKVVLPSDVDVDGAQVPPGTVAVSIEYPFSLIMDPFTGSSGDIQEVWLSGGAGSKVIPFSDFKLRQTATAAQLVSQEVN